MKNNITVQYDSSTPHTHTEGEAVSLNVLQESLYRFAGTFVLLSMKQSYAKEKKTYQYSPGYL